MRRPITKHLPAFPALCRRIAEDYAAMGVAYAELIAKLPPEKRQELEAREAARKKFMGSLTPEQKELWKAMRPQGPQGEHHWH